MTRETENAVLLLVGLCTAIIVVTGSYSRYVKPTLLPWLACAAVLLIALALMAIGRDIRRGSAHDEGAHRHRSPIVWLLVVPIALLGFIVPPAIMPSAVGPTVTDVSTDVLSHPFTPLPAERAPTLSLPDVLMRVAQDSAGTLDGRLVTITGFTLKQDGRTYLGRVVIMCCAADARLAQIRVGGPAVAQMASYPENTWVTVEGKVPTGQQDSTRRTIPLLEVYRASQTEPPKNPYAY